MKDKQNTDYFLAQLPFTIKPYGVVDSLGHTVITCNDDNPPCTLYSETKVDQMDEHFMCDKCGRIGLRMEEATPQQCRLDVEPQTQEARG